jgi:Arc/MetJ family transcription regulator
MRTTVVLDDELVAQAREVLGGKSLRAMIEDSLREAIRARLREDLLRALGTGELELTYSEEELHEMRRDRHTLDADEDWDTDARPEATDDSAGTSAAGT